MLLPLNAEAFTFRPWKKVVQFSEATFIQSDIRTIEKSINPIPVGLISDYFLESFEDSFGKLSRNHGGYYKYSKWQKMPSTWLKRRKKSNVFLAEKL